MNEQIQEIRYQVGEAWKGTYNGTTVYGNANVVQDPTGLSVYRSLKSGNVGHPLSDTQWWFCIIDLSSIKAESDRLQQIDTQVENNEATRINNEETRVSQEQARVNAETNRIYNEQQRENAETDRIRAEQDRVTQENLRISQEQGRVGAEQRRVTAEAARVQAEGIREAKEEQRQLNENNRVAAEQERVQQYASEHQQAEADHTRAEEDHTRAESDHTTATGDHTQAGSDHTRAESDHITAAGDHTQAGNDHTRAESDHTTAAGDHTQAGNDHTRAGEDHTQAVADHEQAAADHETIAPLQQSVAFMEQSFGKYDTKREITLSQAKAGKYVSVAGAEVSASGYGISNSIELLMGDILLIPSAQAVPADVSPVARIVTRTYQKVINYTYTYQQANPELYDTATADYDQTLIYTAVYDTSGETPVLTGWTRGGQTYTTLPATHEVTESYYEPLIKQSAAAMPSTGYYVYLCPQAMTVVISGLTATVDGGVCLAVGWGIFKNIVSNFLSMPGQNTVAQAIAQLTGMVEGIVAQLANLGETRAICINSEDVPKVQNYPMIITGSGAPAAPNVPVFVGQKYLDVTNKKEYTAFSVTNSISDWVLIN